MKYSPTVIQIEVVIKSGKKIIARYVFKMCATPIL